MQANTTLRVACIGHALKESLTPPQCLAALTQGVQNAGAKVCASLCISDGGDGFLEAQQACFPYALTKDIVVRAPHHQKIRARYLLIPQKSIAIIESAEAVGLRRVPPEERRILALGTGGLAELLLDAISEGMHEILVGLGGSATCDGGIGMLGLLNDVLVRGYSPEQARWLTAYTLAAHHEISVTRIREELSRRQVTVRAAVDVDSPLLGPRGAAQQFAPQKGASPNEVVRLERLLSRFADDLECALGEDLRHQEGVGAAGGLGFAFRALGASIEKGADVFLNLPEFLEAFAESDIIITAEGRFDETSFSGKAPWRVAQAGRRRGKEVAIFCATADSRAVEKAELAGVSVVPFALAQEQRDAHLRAHELLLRTVACYFSTKR
ncbi:MAG: glycerate kinase [Candidatus Sumerlaeaceae bacterium]|nr:glycerate kinase [Candidatus Sumerlaeaceae bacterium]